MSIVKACARPVNKRLAQNINDDILLSLYTVMVKIRLLEDHIGRLVATGHIKTPCHLYIGQEAVAAGVCAHLNKQDTVFSTHRSHGHYLAKGGPLDQLVCEIFGKATGCCGGRGGSMHIANPSLGLPGSSAIVGGTIPLAVGSALGFSLQKKNNVAVAFFGDGATTEGIFYESLNFAALNKLPIVFVCENNFYSTHMHISKIQSVPQLYKIGELFNIPSRRISGYDVLEVYNAAETAIRHARRGEGPYFIEAVTYRWRGHVGPNWDLDKALRSREEVYFWVKNCTIKRFEVFLLQQGLLTKEKRRRIFRDLHSKIRKALKLAKESPYPGKKVLEDVYA